MKKEKIKKINCELPKDWSEEKYTEAKKSYIASYQEYIEGYSTGGFFGSYVKGRYENRPDVGLAKWEENYPEGLKSWQSNRGLNPMYVLEMAVKLNEIIDKLNEVLAR